MTKFEQNLIKRLNARNVKTFPTVEEMADITVLMESEGESKFYLLNVEDTSSGYYYLEARTGTTIKHGKDKKYIAVVFDHDVYFGDCEEDLLETMTALEAEAEEVLKILNK